MTRPLGRGRRAIWLTVHLIGMVGWMGVLAAALALDLGLATWPVDAPALGALNNLMHTVQWAVLIPCAAATVGSGAVLARPYQARGCPRWLVAKIWLVAAVVVLGAVVVGSHTSMREYLDPARTAGLVALLGALVLSVTRPNGQRPGRVTATVGIRTRTPASTGGRHRK